MIPKTRIPGFTYAAQGLSLPSPRMAARQRGARMTADQSSTPFPTSLPQRQGPRQVDTGAANYYEALTPSHDRTQVPTFIYALRSVLQSFNRTQLLFLARYLYDNDGIVSLTVNTIADYSSPVMMVSATGDADADQVLNDYFNDWTSRADFSGRFNFNTLQRLISIACDVDGDILPVMTGDNGFPQVQLIEGWRVDSQAIANSVESNRIVDGVRLSPKGTVEGYYVVNALNNLLVGKSVPELVSSSVALLIGDPERYSSLRYITPLRRGSNDIRDAKDIKAFEKTATKIHAALSAVIEGGGPIEEDIWGNTSTDSDATGNSYSQEGNLPPEDATQQEKKLDLWEMLGGDVPTLEDGQKLHQLNNDRPGVRVPEFLSFLGTYMIAGLNIPPNFILNSGLTGPGERSVNGKAQRKFDRRQELLAGFGKWAWVRVIAHGIEHDGLPAVPGWDKPEWQGPPKVSIDEGRDSDQWRQDFKNGLMTRENHYGNRSLDWKREIDQGFNEDAYIFAKARKIADESKVPIETVLTRWGYDNAGQPAQKTSATPGKVPPAMEKQP